MPLVVFRVAARILPVAGLVVVLFILLSGRAHAQAPVVYVDRTPGDALLAYWKFDEGDNSATADYASVPLPGHPGTIMNGALFTYKNRSPMSQALFNPYVLEFDGRDDYIVVPDSPALNVAERFTLAAWVQRSADDGASSIYASGSDEAHWHIGFAADGRLFFAANAGEPHPVLLQSPDPMNDGRWHHIAVTRESAGGASAAGSIVLYVDGQVVAQGSAAAIVVPGGEKWIGRRQQAADSQFQGYLDEVRLYGRALSPYEIGRLAAGRGCATDGKRWESAFVDLHCALDEVPANGEIWIARGLYIPGVIEATTYQLRGLVDLYGGFVGTETERSQRPAFIPPTTTNLDPAQYTILSGDRFANDDPADERTRIENCLHILTGSGVFLPATVDGLVVAHGSVPYGPGGGLLNDNGLLTLRNVAFVDNHAAAGGAIWTLGARLVLNGVTFLGNVATNEGGAIYASRTKLYLANSRFAANRAARGAGAFVAEGKGNISVTAFDTNLAGDSGGGLLLADSTMRLTAVELVDNSASRGGGIYLAGGHIEVSRSTIRGNAAQLGGGLAAMTATVTITGSHFVSNTATVAGGGSHHADGAGTYSDTSFEGNTAAAGGAMVQAGGQTRHDRLVYAANRTGEGGGALYVVQSADAAISNAEFVGNRTAGAGGAVAVDHATLLLINATLYGNEAPTGAIVSGSAGASIALKNSTFWGSGATPFVADGGSTISSDHNLVEGAIPTQPDFVRIPSSGDGRWETLTDNDYGDLSVQSGSPAIDAGDSNAVPPYVTTDLRGNARFLEEAPVTGADTLPVVDIGAYEYFSGIPFAMANGPYSGVEGIPVSVSAEGSYDYNGAIASYAWDCNDDGQWDVTTISPTAACSYPDDGAYALRLRVADNEGSSREASTLIQVVNAAPVYSPPPDRSVPFNASVDFDLGAFSDSGVVDAWDVAVDWRDGHLGLFSVTEQGALPTIGHAFPAEGVYTVTVRISDDDGGSTIGRFVVTVTPTDSDFDGLTDQQECPVLNACPDSDGDGVPDYLDPDDDGDGVLTRDEVGKDTDGDGLPDYLDTDDEDDGMATLDEGALDTDGDGIPDFLDEDDDGDGLPTQDEMGLDSDQDGISNHLDSDDDGDSIPTVVEGTIDTDGDSVPNFLDIDDDDDTLPSIEEGTIDTDSDGLPNYLDADDDGDGFPTRDEAGKDSNGNGIPDHLERNYFMHLPILRR